MFKGYDVLSHVTFQKVIIVQYGQIFSFFYFNQGTLTEALKIRPKCVSLTRRNGNKILPSYTKRFFILTTQQMFCSIHSRVLNSGFRKGNYNLQIVCLINLIVTTNTAFRSSGNLFQSKGTIG